MSGPRDQRPMFVIEEAKRIHGVTTLIEKPAAPTTSASLLGRAPDAAGAGAGAGYSSTTKPSPTTSITNVDWSGFGVPDLPPRRDDLRSPRHRELMDICYREYRSTEAANKALDDAIKSTNLAKKNKKKKKRPSIASIFNKRDWLGFNLIEHALVDDNLFMMTALIGKGVDTSNMFDSGLPLVIYLAAYRPQGFYGLLQEAKDKPDILAAIKPQFKTKTAEGFTALQLFFYQDDEFNFQDVLTEDCFCQLFDETVAYDFLLWTLDGGDKESKPEVPSIEQLIVDEIADRETLALFACLAANLSYAIRFFKSAPDLLTPRLFVYLLHQHKCLFKPMEDGSVPFNILLDLLDITPDLLIELNRCYEKKGIETVLNYIVRRLVHPADPAKVFGDGINDHPVITGIITPYCHIPAEDIAQLLKDYGKPTLPVGLNLLHLAALVDNQPWIEYLFINYPEMASEIAFGKSPEALASYAGRCFFTVARLKKRDQTSQLVIKSLQEKLEDSTSMLLKAKEQKLQSTERALKLTQELERSEENLLALSKTSGECQEQFKIMTKISNLLKDDIQSLQSSFKASGKELDRLKTELATSEAKAEKLAARLSSSRKKLEPLKKELSTAKQQVAQMQKEIKEQKAEIIRLKEIKECSEHGRETLQEALTTAETARAEAESMLVKTLAEREVMAKELEAAMTSSAQATARATDSESIAKQLHASLLAVADRLKEEREVHQTLVQNLEQKRRELSNDLKTKVKDNANFLAKNVALLREISSLKDEIAQLETPSIPLPGGSSLRVTDCTNSDLFEWKMFMAMQNRCALKMPDEAYAAQFACDADTNKEPAVPATATVVADVRLVKSPTPPAGESSLEIPKTPVSA